MICAGVDAGSRAIKVVLFDDERAQVLSMAVADQGIDLPRLAAEVFARALQDAQLARERVSRIVATGYGRNRVDFADTTITEITCHARGVFHLMPETRTVIEIGGQDSKIICLQQDGRVRDFALNDRCAAGTGRFLEMLAERFGVGLCALGELGRQSVQPAIINSTCVVFAETEIVGLVADGIPAPDIAAGVQRAIASRVLTLLGRAVEPPVCFTGGVALQSGMTAALQTALGCPVAVAPNPQYTGALGAALLAGVSGRGGTIRRGGGAAESGF